MNVVKKKEENIHISTQLDDIVQANTIIYMHPNIHASVHAHTHTHTHTHLHTHTHIQTLYRLLW